MFKTLSTILLLFFMMIFAQCASTKSNTHDSAPINVAEAQKIIEAKRAEQIRNADRLKKEALKRNLQMQTKAVRKSLKKNKKKLKKQAKNKRKNKSLKW